ncbi:uncharacterized protein LOC108411577 [Pygocentrus nattereri]|uniref:uncharacterized protein LOC108411577 n=1 Tax=Pygocentrus nattereri TaxID=42514 RepID=UPI0018919296|nr:uncharacterized protein LOC108411577 [Pygocentrus nattereri]
MLIFLQITSRDVLHGATSAAAVPPHFKIKVPERLRNKQLGGSGWARCKFGVAFLSTHDTRTEWTHSQGWKAFPSWNLKRHFPPIESKGDQGYCAVPEVECWRQADIMALWPYLRGRQLQPKQTHILQIPSKPVSFRLVSECSVKSPLCSSPAHPCHTPQASRGRCVTAGNHLVCSESRMPAFYWGSRINFAFATHSKRLYTGIFSMCEFSCVYLLV